MYSDHRDGVEAGGEGRVVKGIGHLVGAWMVVVPSAGRHEALSTRISSSQSLYIIVSIGMLCARGLAVLNATARG